MFKTQLNSNKPCLITTSLAALNLLFITPSMASSKGLNELFLNAQMNDATLAQSRLQKSIHEQKKPMISADLKPKLALNGAASISRNSDNIYDLRSVSTSISMQKALYTPQIKTQLDIVNQKISQSEIEQAETEQHLMLKLAQAYFQVLITAADLKLIDNKLKTDIAQYEQTSISNSAGIASKTDVLEAKSNLDASAADEITFKNAFENAVNSLEMITGIKIESIRSLDNPKEVKINKANLINSLTAAMKENTSIQIAQLNLDQAINQVAFEEQRNAPSINLNMNYGYKDFSGFSEQMSMQYEDRYNFEIGVQATIPIYDGGLKKAKISQANLEVKFAQQQLKNQKEQIELAVKQSVRNLQRNIAYVKALNESKNSTQAFLEATEINYESGLRNLVDVLNARTAKVQAERDLIAAQYNLIYEHIYLEQLQNQLTIEDFKYVDTLLTASTQLK